MKPKQPHEVSWIIEQRILKGKEEDMDKVMIRYLRMQNVNARIVVFGQVYHEDGTKLFPTRISDAPLSQLIEFIDDEDYSLENSYEVLSYLVRNGFGV